MRPARHVTRARFRGRGIRRSLLQSPCDWTSQFLCLSEARKLENKLKRQGRGSGFYSMKGIPLGSKSGSHRIVGSEPSEARQTDRRSAPQGEAKPNQSYPHNQISDASYFCRLNAASRAFGRSLPSASIRNDSKRRARWKP